MKRITLYPCKFCGQANIEIVCTKRFYVWCPYCKKSTIMFNYMKQAIKTWFELEEK